jgi:hypothetical protein
MPKISSDKLLSGMKLAKPIIGKSVDRRTASSQ